MWPSEESHNSRAAFNLVQEIRCAERLHQALWISSRNLWDLDDND